MSIKIPGINFEEGGSSMAMIYESTVSVVININQTYNVPAGRVFRGLIMGTSSAVRVEIGSSGIYMDVPDAGQTQGDAFVEVAGGTSITCRNDNSLQIRGALYVAG